MLVVVFGAGASFDSNPALPLTAGRRDEDRPPLANGLFDMDRQATREAAGAFPRAAPALMAARADVKAGLTIETTLSRLQEQSGRDPLARSQLMALRFYLQRVLHRVPDAWDRRADRQTSYVSMLDQLARWRRATGEGLCLVTFNYDVLLERACTVVFGSRFGAMDDYQATEGLHVFKPHGSVDWAQGAEWTGAESGRGDDFRRYLCDHPDLEVSQDQFQVRAPEGPVQTSDNLGVRTVWLPALAIPVELKPDVVMPENHRAALAADLSRASAMICVGWRAREQHFLRLLQDQLPSAPLPVWSVSGTAEDAQETIDNLWPTGRFDRQRAVGGGFARFADPEPPPTRQPREPEPVLGHVLRGSATGAERPPGPGLAALGATPGVTYSSPAYGPLA